jgi:hypothetical protein
LKAVTNQLAQFSLGEEQKEAESSSYVLLFRKILAITLDMQRFPCLVLERPDPLSSEFTQRRVLKDVSNFSDEEKCVFWDSKSSGNYVSQSQRTTRSRHCF